MPEQLPSRLAMRSAAVNGTPAVSMPISYRHEPAVRRCARHEKYFFLPGASSSIWDCRLIRRPAKDARLKREPCPGRVQGKAFGHQKMAVSIRQRHAGPGIKSGNDGVFGPSVVSRVSKGGNISQIRT